MFQLSLEIWILFPALFLQTFGEVMPSKVDSRMHNHMAIALHSTHTDVHSHAGRAADRENADYDTIDMPAQHFKYSHVDHHLAIAKRLSVNSIITSAH